MVWTREGGEGRVEIEEQVGRETPAGEAEAGDQGVWPLSATGMSTGPEGTLGLFLFLFSLERKAE